MNIFRELFEKELRAHFLDWKVFLYSVLCLFLVTGSFCLHQQQYQVRLDDHYLQSALLRKHMEAGGRIYRNMYEYTYLAENGFWISFKPAPLSAFCRGVETFEAKIGGVAFNLRDDSKMPFFRTEKYRNPFRDFFTHLDVAGIVMFILSLLVLVFSYDAIAREREEGTLKLMLSHAVPRGHIILAKLAAGYAVILVPLVTACLLCVVIARLSARTALPGPETAAALLIVLVASLYLLVFYCLGLLVSTVFRQSATALAVLMLLWLVFIVVVHNATIVGTELMVKGKMVSDYVNDLWQQGEQLQNNQDQRVQKKYGRPYGQLTEDEKAEVLAAMLDDRERVLCSVLDDWAKQQQKEYRVLRLTGLLSPSTIFITSASELAGTGVAGQIYQTNDLRRYLVFFKNELLRQWKIDRDYPNLKPSLGRYSDNPEKMKFIIQEIAPYQSRPMPLAERVNAALWSVFVLAGYAVLFFLLAFYAFIKTEVH